MKGIGLTLVALMAFIPAACQASSGGSDGPVGDIASGEHGGVVDSVGEFTPDAHLGDQARGSVESAEVKPDVADAEVDAAQSLDEGGERPPPAEVLRLDELAESFRLEQGLPGAGIVAFSASGLVALGVAGLRKHGGTALIQDGDKFHLGSCTKAMTGTLVARLVEQGIMDFDASLMDLFPDVKVHVDLQSVTIRQLLRHEGGVYSEITSQAPELWASLWEAGDENIMATRESFAESVLTTPPPHDPGSYHYSNTGYILVGAAVESALTMSWEEAMTLEVFEPLKMEGCGFGAPGDPEGEDQPWGHRTKNGQTQRFPPGPQGDNPPALGPAGTVHCPLASWTNFMTGHLGGGPPGYLQASSWDELHTTGTASDYALGWLVTDVGVLQHFGSNTKNVAGAWLYKADGMGYAMVTNSGPSNAIKGPMHQLLPEVIAAVSE